MRSPHRFQTMVSHASNRLSIRRSTLVWCVGFILFTLSGPTSLSAADWRKLSDSVFEANKWRAAAEGRVRAAKERFKPASTQLAHVRQKYEETRGAFNAWRDALKADLATGGSWDSRTQQQRLEQARDGVTYFMGYTDAVIEGDKRGIGQMVLGAALQGMIGTAFEEVVRQIRLYRESRSADPSQISKVLDELEWKSFESI